jgi:predicted HicB family RNase H-like nuclease
MNKDNFVNYKDYYGSVQFDPDQEIFYGRVEFIRDLITFEAQDAKSIIPSFRDAVDDYLKSCSLLNKKPNVSFKGSFNIRISPDLHRKLGVYAASHQNTINNVVKSALTEFLDHHYSP